MNTRILTPVLALAALLVLGGCGNKTLTLFPEYSAAGPGCAYKGEELFRLMGDDAEKYYHYNFMQLAVRFYREGNTVVMAEIWEFHLPVDAEAAYKHLTPEGGTPYFDAGGRLLETAPGLTGYFLSDRCYCRIVSFDNSPTARELIRRVSEHLNKTCPTLHVFKKTDYFQPYK